MLSSKARSPELLALTGHMHSGVGVAGILGTHGRIQKAWWGGEKWGQEGKGPSLSPKILNFSIEMVRFGEF